VKRGEGDTNSPKLSFLKILPLAYHHSHFLAAISWQPSWISHLFSLWPFWGRTLFLQLGCFGLDPIYFMLMAHHTYDIKSAYYVLLTLSSFLLHKQMAVIMMPAQLNL